jgi:hypothetical protein
MFAASTLRARPPWAVDESALCSLCACSLVIDTLARKVSMIHPHSHNCSKEKVSAMGRVFR